jgi:predicted adenylyl cyclase CyaB
MHINYEFKARSNDIDALEKKLLILQPLFIGEDHQVDTYFNVNKGRLKLREGTIEHSLIYYERPDVSGPKQSDVLLYEHSSSAALKKILTKIHGIKTIVDKKRKIYFIENIKFHFDRVKDLGTFVEVEAIDKTGETGIEKLMEQCNHYVKLFGIREDDFIDRSYSDMIMGTENLSDPYE